MEARPQQLIIFTRYPVPGRVKTRLIPALGEQGAADLHRRLAEYTIEQAQMAAGRLDAGLEIHFAGGNHELMQRWLGDALCFRQQLGDDLGARIAHAFAGVFAAGAGAAVLIGSDCPDLHAGRCAEAFARLAGTAAVKADTGPGVDLVLGPAVDGGYYLIGLTRPVPALFRDIRWGSNEVLARTRAIATQCGLRWQELEELADVDRPEDLPRASRFIPVSPPAAERER